MTIITDAQFAILCALLALCFFASGIFNLVIDLIRTRGRFRRYPRPDGDVVSIGPECFASKDENVISWRGRNYYQNPF